ncbi:MAG: choice-of-anchor D domain-containing protein [Oligoflexia bacterium]|nr:choice-of-anchor D domain-containing protein [Oligoflexia bacterium]
MTPPLRKHTAMVILGAALVSACSGGDTSISRLLPDIATAPATLDFGSVRIGEQSSLVAEVVNAGQGSLSVSGIVFSDDIGAYTVSPATLDLPTQSSAEVMVSFEPGALQTYETNLLLASNDSANPLVTIPVSGVGIEGGPDLQLDIDALDFGTVDLDSTSSRLFTITNAGDEDLEIYTTSLQGGSGAFTLDSDPRGEIIPVASSFPVLVSYSPTSTEGDLGTFTLDSNDPDDPQVTATFIGNGGGASEYPVALISATTQAEPGDTIILDGSASYDPGGNTPLAYTWTLIDQPTASTSDLYSATLSAPSLNLDTAGSYTVSLQVSNSLGVPSATAVHTVAAIPEEAIYVALTWDTDRADLDLHLVQNDGTLLFDGFDDCSWCNENPDWGVTGDSTDDPLLAQDSDSGGGPETIVVSTPADGEYFVRVHYFQDDGDGETQATVRIYLQGTLIDQYRQDLTHNQVWDVAYIRWPEGYVIEEDADPYAAKVRSCQY